MKEYKLLLLVNGMNRKEYKEFGKFVHSEFYNTNVKIVELFDYLINEKSAFEEGKPNKKRIYEHLFPGKKYKDLHCRQYLSNLTSLIEQYFFTKRFNESEDLKTQLLLEEMIERNSEKLFNHTLLKTKTSKKYKNGDQYLNDFKIEDIKNRYISHFAQRQNRFIAQPDYANTIKQLDTFYLIYKLKYCCELLNYKTIGAVEQETILLDEILELLQKEDYSEIPAVTIYHNILLNLIEPEIESHYTKFIDTLKENDHLFPQLETREMYIYAQNFCIRQINKGSNEYLFELLTIYKILLNRGIILVNDELSPWDYKNIVVSALRCSDFDWVESFIEEYKESLPIEERENAYIYNLAKFHFYKKNYGSVMQLLQKVEYNDVFYSLDSKAMLLKTYYELNELDSLFSLLDSFNSFLRRKKQLSKQRVESYKNLIKLVKKLVKLNSKTLRNTHEILEEIRNTKPLADSSWLKEKVQEFAK